MRHTIVCSLFALIAGCGHSSPAPAPVTTVSVSGGRVTITGELGQHRPFTIRNAEVRVRVDRQLFTTAGKACQSSAAQPLSCDLGQGLSLQLASTPEKGGLLLTATVTGSGTHRVDGFEVLDTHASDAALDPSGQPTTLRYLHNGYQSWSFSGVLDLTPGTTLTRQGDVIAYPAPDGAASIDEKLGLSSHDAVISGGDGTAMVLGYVSTRLWQGAIGLEAPATGFKLTAQCGFTGDSVPLNGSVESETLYVKYDTSPEAAMNDYGQELAARQETRSQPPAVKQRGWFSWNRYFDMIDQPTVLAQADAMHALVGGQGFNLVEIDDGWEKAWGDWNPNGKFKPIGQLAAARHSAGQTLGLWVAPFVVEQSDLIVARHPDWWVKDLTGKPLVHTPTATSHHLMIVDTTQPDALAWAVGNLATLQAQGVDFFKLDFLYAAALDGERADPSATGVTALTKGLQAIFNGIGPAAVNLCGVPWLHAALAPPTTIRIGPDVAYSVGASGFALVGVAAQNLEARAFGPIAHRSDPDQFWLSPLTPAERRTALTIQALAGESFSLADDLTALSPDEQALVTQAAQLTVPLDPTAPFESRGLFDAAGTQVTSAIVEVLNGADEVQSVLPSVLVRGNLLAATNWGDASAAVDLHLNAGETATAIWGPAPSGGKVQLASHDTGLYRLTTK